MTASGEARQLALELAPEPAYTAADFIATPGNQEARAWLTRPEAWPHGRLALWGEAGEGKTHLLRLWADASGAARLAGPRLRALPSPPLPARIALDDADLCPDETMLLHLLNLAAEQGTLVLLAGRAPPARWPVRLPDLASRLRATLAVRVGPTDETSLAALLARLIAARQLVVPDPVQAWLLARLPRHPAALREVVARLDRAALAARAPIGRALAARVLTEMQDADMPDCETPDGPTPGGQRPGVEASGDVCAAPQLL